jgi:hypothetical protein
MNYKDNKIIYLLLGLILGFFVAGGVIWWKLDKHNFFSDLFSKNIIVKNDYNDDKQQEKEFIKKKYEYQKAKFKIPDTFIDSLKSDTSKLSVEELIELYNNEITKDTLDDRPVSHENIVVTKDEMITSRMVNIIGEVPSDNEQYELDSILTENYKTKRKSPDMLRVEFWRSPLNYKGYKMDDNKLVVFGLLEVNNLSLLGHNNQLFIKYNKDYYSIDYTDNFKPFNQVRNESIIKTLSTL